MNSSLKYPNAVFLHSPLHFNLYAVNLAAPMTARSGQSKERAPSSASVGGIFIDPTAAL